MNQRADAGDGKVAPFSIHKVLLCLVAPVRTIDSSVEIPLRIVFETI